MKREVIWECKSFGSVNHFNSNFIMSRIVVTEKPTHIGCMHLESNGVIGFHQATVQQLLLIVAGDGWVRGNTPDALPVGVGDAIFWDAHEWHETKTDTGLTAIVIESEGLNPARYMPVRDSG
jgi:quercetin dioxygenase-like cupin family protein